MKQLKIVLVEPQIPQNTGNIARTCAVTGASLHLVRPMGFTVTDKHLKRAGLDYWHKLDITYYDDWADFVAKHADEQDQFYFFTTKGKHVHSDLHRVGQRVSHLWTGGQRTARTAPARPRKPVRSHSDAAHAAKPEPLELRRHCNL